MLDIVAHAIVLKKEFLGDYDAIYTFFTKDYGKVSARAKSVRKIASRLAAHLEPGLLSGVRLVARGGRGERTHFQVADALLDRRLFTDFSFLELVDGMALSLHADSALWDFLLTGNSERKKLLALSGFGEEQTCLSCSLPAVSLYHPDQAFLCARCSAEIPKELVTYLN